MIIYQRNIEERILIKLEEENGSWNISKYYDKNTFFIVEKNNNHSSIINIGFCMLNGEHFKITEEGKNRKFKYENNRLYIEHEIPEDNIYCILEGGFGNQLFMIFNIIALAIKYNKTYNVSYNENYTTSYYKNKNVVRKSNRYYKTLQNINDKKMNNTILNNYNKYFEPEYTYTNIELLPKINYKIEGYYQSYKYFWDYKDEIKKHIVIDESIMNDIRNKFNKFNKKIISIHIRLGDYLLNADYHPIPSISYYKQALSYYNLVDYQIILFSDDIELAKKKLEPLNITYIDANTINENDEYQFYMLCLSDIKICANSSFSLMSCYLSDIYKFKEDAEYIFPHKWFGKTGPKYNINDLIPNTDNYKIINTDEVYGIFLIATGKYINYLDIIVPNIKEKLLHNTKKILFITTDNIEYISKFNYLLDETYHIVVNYTKCRGFPADTLYRFKYFLDFKNKYFNFNGITNIINTNYLIFMNVNLHIKKDISYIPFTTNLFFTQHPGCAIQNMELLFDTSVELRSNLTCYIDKNKIQDKTYICGGFNGGKTTSYLEMAYLINKNIIKDDNNELIAKWHDESYLNWYRLQLDKTEYDILNYLYCCCEKYDSNTYINIIHKDHLKVRYNNNMYINYTSDLNTDILRYMYYIKQYDKDVTIPILNNKYFLSSRQGLLSNFERIDLDSEGFKGGHIDIINNIEYDLILDYNFLKTFITRLHVQYEDIVFKKKYNNHIVIHISDDFHLYRRTLYEYCNKNNDKQFIVVFHSNKYINDKVWDNINNIEIINFKNDEEKIIMCSLLSNHVFYNLNDVYVILFMGKLKWDNIGEINWLYNKTTVNINQTQFIKYNFNVNLISIELNPGFSFIIRARNEILNVKYCLRSLEPILTLFPQSEIIFVDNNSIDKTYDIAKTILSKYTNVKVLRYNVPIPPCGEEHKRVIKDNIKLSLGEYYKWCYSFGSRYNVIKWDCDFICNIQNLIEMIHKYNLDTFSGNISVWFSGLQLFMYNNEPLLDNDSYFLYNEPRIHSKLNGFEYKNSPDLLWETPYTDYLIKNETNNNSYHFGFPTGYYIIRMLERNNKVKKIRNISNNLYKYIDYVYESNKSEIIRYNFKKNKIVYDILQYQLRTTIKPVFFEIKNVNNILKQNNLRNMDKRDTKIIKLIKSIQDNTYEKHNITKNMYLQNKLQTINNEITVCVLILTCDKYKHRLTNIKKQLVNVKYKYYFLEASEKYNKTYIDNNRLIVNCDECYENLPKKVLLAYEYLYNNTNYDYIIKMDDDTIINENKLQEMIDNRFYNLDYIGSKAGGGVDKKWHFGKCKNKKLNNKPYWNKYIGDWCGGGFGYILSRSSISLLIKAENYKYIWNEIYEDKAIGDILRKENIKPQFEFLPNLKITKKVGFTDDDYIFISSH